MPKVLSLIKEWFCNISMSGTVSVIDYPKLSQKMMENKNLFLL